MCFVKYLLFSFITFSPDPETKQPKIIQYDDVVVWSKKDFELKQYDKDDKKHEGTAKIRTIDIEIDGEEFYMLNLLKQIYQMKSTLLQ